MTSEWAEAHEDLLVRFLRASIKGCAGSHLRYDAAGTLSWEYCGSISEGASAVHGRRGRQLACPEGFDPNMIGYIDRTPSSRRRTISPSTTRNLAATPVVDESTFTSK